MSTIGCIHWPYQHRGERDSAQIYDKLSPISSANKKIFSHIHTNVPGDNHNHHRNMDKMTKNPLWETRLQVRHILQKAQSISLALRVYRCLMFGHASLFDEHFRMPGRIVWKICRIPWTSVR